MDILTKKVELTDSQKVAMCIGFLKGLVQNSDYYTSVSVKCVEDFIKEIK